MRTKRLVAAVAAAAGLVGMAFVATAGPASAWTLKDCEKTWAAGKDHPDCTKYKTTTTTKATTTTKKAEATTTTVKGATTSTTVKGTEETHVEAVKATPNFTG